ncbi:MAG: isocitrate lyase [Streptosporangiales bacterium]|nr:isocitrate lyase [Streptosporangiales bacterium]
MNGAGARALRTMLRQPGIVVAPGVYDGLSARIAAAAGFGALYVSGGAVARSGGVPDLGLLTMTEVLGRIREVVDAVAETGIVVIADADTGYGNALNTRRTVREFERLGVAALHIEDQVTPKKCGHYDDKALISTAEMCGKIRAATDARIDDDTVLIVRTDAIATDGLDAALERGARYVEAGADVLFVEAPTSREEIVRIGAALDVPLLINMFAGGKTPQLPAGELEAAGYKLMIAPSDLQRAAMAAMRAVAKELKETGSTAGAGVPMAAFAERDELVALAEFQRLEARYAS